MHMSMQVGIWMCVIWCVLCTCISKDMCLLTQRYIQIREIV